MSNLSDKFHPVRSSLAEVLRTRASGASETSNGIHSRLGLIVTIIAVLLLISAGLFYFLNLSDKNGMESREFAGRIDKIEDNLIYISGSFVSPEHPELGKDQKQVIVEISAKTKFRKTLLYLPSKEELEKTGGVFYSQDLERKVEEVDFNQLTADFSQADGYIGGFSIYAKTKASIYGLDKFRSEEIEYIVATRPVKQQQQPQE